MPDLAISLATDAERDWSARLMSESEPWLTLGRALEQCHSYLATTSDSELLIAHDDDAPAGFLLARPRGFAGSPYVAAIAVGPAQRSRGVGSALLRHVEARYVPPARHIFLLCSTFNLRAQRLYARHGYARVGEIPAYVIASANELIFHKRLVR